MQRSRIAVPGQHLGKRHPPLQIPFQRSAESHSCQGSVSLQGPQSPEDGQPTLEQESQLAEKSLPFQIGQSFLSQEELPERADRTDLQDMRELTSQFQPRFLEAFCSHDPLPDSPFLVPGFPAVIGHFFTSLLLLPFGTERKNPSHTVIKCKKTGIS